MNGYGDPCRAVLTSRVRSLPPEHQLSEPSAETTATIEGPESHQAHTPLPDCPAKVSESVEMARPPPKSRADSSSHLPFCQ